VIKEGRKGEGDETYLANFVTFADVTICAISGFFGSGVGVSLAFGEKIVFFLYFLISYAPNIKVIVQKSNINHPFKIFRCLCYFKRTDVQIFSMVP